MAVKKAKDRRFRPPETTDGMCGRCQHWSLVGDDESGQCALLAVVFKRGDRVKRRLPERDMLWSGRMEREVYERTMAATEGWQWVEEDARRIEPSEYWMDVPKERYDDRGEKQKIWEHLSTYEWFSCARHEARKERAA